MFRTQERLNALTIIALESDILKNLFQKY